MQYLFFFSSRRRHTRCLSDWSSDVCSSDLYGIFLLTSTSNYFFTVNNMLTLQHPCIFPFLLSSKKIFLRDRKSTRLNSSHLGISYAVFCLRTKEYTSELQSLRHVVYRLLLEQTHDRVGVRHTTRSKPRA